MKKFIQGELSNWTRLELGWLLSATLIIIGVSISWGDSMLGIISSISGVFCVVLVGKGKISNYFFGVINVSLYAFIAYQAGYYGDTMLNLGYYLPMNFIGLYLWAKNKNDDTGEVIKQRLKPSTMPVLGAVSVLSVVGYGFFLKGLGGNLPFVDSISTVFSIIAQLLCAFRMTEQWIFWIVVNVVSVFMWVVAFLEGSDSIATLLMWCVYLVNAIIMWIAWTKDTKTPVASN